MDATECLYVILFCYGALFFFDRFFKSCSMYPYIAFLNGTGLNIGFLRISWRTTAFNRTLLKIGTKYKNLLNIWFDIGIYVTIILLPISIGVLLYAAFQIFVFSSTTDKVASNKDTIIEPIIPGVTSPLNEIGYYAITLLISSCLHELGHAIAAVREDIHIIEVGCSAFFILPVAFVIISNDQLQTLNVKKKLRVLCAGVWHNLVIAVIAYLIFISLPLLFMPFYALNRGVYVSEVSHKSPLRGQRGIEVGDIIVGINEHKIYNDQTWFQALTRTIKQKPGYCVETDFVHALDESVVTEHHEINGLIECCGPNKGQNLCFEYLEASDGIVQLPPHMCLPARKIVEHAKTLCYSGTCSLDLHCIKPVLPNATSLLSISRYRKDHVIYIGHPSDVFYSVQVSAYVPKTWFLSSKFAERIDLLLKYLVVFSLGLVIVNIIPCWYLDGEHIIVAVVQLVLARRIQSKLVKDVISLSLTIFGTVFLILVILGTLLMKLFY
ncbi:membrane-bound transcription factor site-2 protease [Chrysoperla carnea]|uniref:membrane-bound transcription factor site-2 protease n=1 Tax=Chrysoperla carnea TaxID=189513 RepID=UPI001D06613E|nr:membrane-bound transcription factor site-2 protease [Chrysoperla carnea]